MTTVIPRIKGQNANAELATRVAVLAKTRKALSFCWPHLEKLGPGERRLIRVCEWSLTANKPVTKEQSDWLDDIVNRVTPPVEVAA